MPPRRKASDYHLITQPQRSVSPYPRPRRYTLRISRQRAVLLGLLLLYFVWRSYSGGGGLAETVTAPITSLFGASEPCLKDLPSPDERESFYSFPLSAKPYSGRYVAIHRKAQQTQSPTVSEEPADDREPPPACLDDLFTKGTPCHDRSASHPHLDIVWAYANGSDHLHQSSYHEPAQPPSVMHESTRRSNILREFDELRFSMRSVLWNFRESVGKMVLLVPEYPFPGCAGRKGWKLGQLPQWLLPAAKMTWNDGGIGLRVLHHSQVFGGSYNKPNYNSLAIESRLPLLEDISDIFIYLNDDIFFASNLSATEFYSAATGPVFQIQPDLLINVNRPKIGEWAALIHTNELLSTRFGDRSRPYVAHTAKVLSMPILREVHSAWQGDLDATASHQYRTTTGVNSDVSVTLMMPHYVIERWREALLWSFVVATMGGDDDQWSEEQLRLTWAKLGGDPKRRDINIRRGHRETLTKLNQEVVGRRTGLVYSSYDGYPYSSMSRVGFKAFPDFGPDDKQRGMHMGNHCTISQQTCFLTTSGSKGPTASEVFKNVAFRVPLCGDCIIAALMTQTGPNGLATFLPDGRRKFPTKLKGAATSTPSSAPRLPLGKAWEGLDFSLRAVSATGTSLTVRQWAIEAMYRYRFAIGSASSSTFVRLETPLQSNATLHRLDSHSGTPEESTLICVNDDVRWQPEVIRDMMRDWMSRRWGKKAAWEV